MTSDGGSHAAALYAVAVAMTGIQNGSKLSHSW